MRATLAADPRFEPTFSCLLDLRFADLTALRGQDIRTLSEGTAFAPSARLVLVMSTAEHFGLGRMYQQLRSLDAREDLPLGVVYTMKAALDWLGLPPEAIPSAGSDEDTEAAG